MILFDTTKTAAAGHRSGLVRVSRRLLEEFGSRARPVQWPLVSNPDPADWYLTAELFSEAERPGFSAWLESRSCRTGAIFHDAIPLKHPRITWPQSVARHPGYMKLLARFDRVWAVSQASKDELEGFWRWLGLGRTPPVEVLALGADRDAVPRIETAGPPATSRPRLLCVGIIEPRKNQGFLVEVCDRLWSEGLAFDLHVVGRVNPHFGKPILGQIKRTARAHRGALVFHEAADEATVTALYRSARASVFPTIAEGCGLPLLESLWMGVPCVCSDLPVLRENADGGGCLRVPVNDASAWADALREVLTDDALAGRLAREAATRALPTWSAAAAMLAAACGRAR